MDDIIAVLDAVGSQRTALFSHSEGGNLAVLFAATYPQRTIALVTAGIFATRIWRKDYPWAPTPEQRAAEIEDLERSWPLRNVPIWRRVPLVMPRSGVAWRPTSDRVRAPVPPRPSIA
jgi:pimeloyl-ACP methyl ester carboxylesterase